MEQSAIISSFHNTTQAFFDKNMSNVLSFPVAYHNFEHLAPYLRHYINNHGDTFFIDSSYWYQKTKNLEKSAIMYLANLYQS